MSQTNSCPFCAEPLKPDHLYVRGIAAALHRSGRADVGALSRSELEQIDLGAVSLGGTGAQAVIPAMHCEACGAVCFKGAERFAAALGSRSDTGRTAVRQGLASGRSAPDTHCHCRRVGVDCDTKNPATERYA